MQGKQPPTTKESLAFNIGFTPKKNLRRLSKFIGKKHTSLDDGHVEGKVRRLIKQFNKNKIEPSPVRSRTRSRTWQGKSQLVEDIFPVRQQRHYSESDSLRRHTLLLSAVKFEEKHDHDAPKMISSPIIRPQVVKLFQWPTDF